MCKPIDMSSLSQKIVKSQLRRRLLKAASKLGLHYFLWRLQSPMAMKGLRIEADKTRTGGGLFFSFFVSRGERLKR